jgi:hypothetical protein
MSFFAVVFAAAALQTAVPAQTPAAPAAAAQAQPEKPEMTCHMERLVGSRFERKVCRTKEDLRMQDVRNREALKHWRPVITPPEDQ